MYMWPFLLNVFFSKRYIHAKVMHRGTSKDVSVASSNSKNIRNTLPSLVDDDACRTIGQLIAERSKDADVFALAYEPKKNERIEGKLAIYHKRQWNHFWLAFLNRLFPLQLLSNYRRKLHDMLWISTGTHAYFRLYKMTCPVYVVWLIAFFDVLMLSNVNWTKVLQIYMRG